MSEKRRWFNHCLNSAFDRWNIRDFEATEFAPERREPPPEHRALMIVPTALVLQDLRDAGCGVITINSGYRDPQYNESVGGAPNSQHILFTAADITTRNWTPDRVADWLDASEWSRLIGMGRYNSFTHIDTRHWKGNPDYGVGPARWDKRH